MRVDKVGQEDSHPWLANGQAKVRFGIVGGPPGDWPTLRDFAQMVEGLGFDSYWRVDHPLLTPDGWTTLAAVAANTQRRRLGSMVTCSRWSMPACQYFTFAVFDPDTLRLLAERVVPGVVPSASPAHAMRG